MERFIDPVIADLQAEHAAARHAGHVWRSRWALVVGYVAVAKVFVLCGLYGTGEAWRNWSRDDQCALTRMMWLSGVAIVVNSLLLYLPFVNDLRRVDASISILTVYLIPSLLALSLPAGLAMSTALAGGRALSRRFIAIAVLIGLAASAASFVNVAWLTPEANQSYREEIAGRLFKQSDRVESRPLRRGQRELTLGELRHLPTGSFDYHTRLAVAIAPLTFVAFGLVLATRRRSTRATAAGAAFVAMPAFLVTIWSGEALARNGMVSSSLAAWMPQILLITTTILLGVGRLKAAATSLTRTRA